MDSIGRLPPSPIAVELWRRPAAVTYCILPPCLRPKNCESAKVGKHAALAQVRDDTFLFMSYVVLSFAVFARNECACREARAVGS